MSSAPNPTLRIRCPDCKAVVDIPEDGTPVTCDCPGDTWSRMEAEFVLD